MTKSVPKMFRRRFIPNENVLLENDKIIKLTDEIIITKWDVLKKRTDFTHGVSCYFLKDNIKVSKFIDANENIIYWYCDIIDWNYNSNENSYTFNDLLVDVIIYENGFVKVVDIAELSSSFKNGIISAELLTKALTTVDNLLTTIYNGNFNLYKKYIENI